MHYRWPVGVSPWRVVPPASHRISRVPWYSGIAPTEPVAVAYRALTVCGAASQRLRLTQLVDFYSATTRLAPAVRCDPTTPPTRWLPSAPPVWAAPVSLATTPGISHLIPRPRGTEMFQFPRCPPRGLCIPPAVSWLAPGGVAPFGSDRLIARLQLPGHVSPLSASFVGPWPLLQASTPHPAPLG